MVPIILIIIALVLEYLFLKHFESIDTELFGAFLHITLILPIGVSTPPLRHRNNYFFLVNHFS